MSGARTAQSQAKAKPQVESIHKANLSEANVKTIQDKLEALQKNIGQTIYGKDQAIAHLVTSLIAGSHLLIEDVPGVGKTSLAIALARSIGGSHQRIQFTSDLLPSDVIGVPIFNQTTNEFEFRKGPLFANIVLADEINRTTPKTQSCMLEAMQDGKVSVDRFVHELPRPFMVVATQNPIEHHGTYPLPESQLDRFLMRLSLGYPAADYEKAILKDPEIGNQSLDIEPVCSEGDIMRIQQAVEQVEIDDSLLDYLLAIVSATRNHEDIELGISTRGSVMFTRAVQAWALLQGRAYVIPDDIKDLAVPVLSHRLKARASFRSALPESESHKTAELLIEQILTEVEVPR